MKRAIALVVYFPALIGWLIFAPAFRAANWLFPNEGKYSHWFWLGVEATEHENYYSMYDDDQGVI
jgi:hypothetical protein